MTIIKNPLYLNSPENNVYLGKAVDSSLSTGQNIVILPPSAPIDSMAMTSNEINILAQGTIAEMEESSREQPLSIQKNTSEPALEDIFGPINIADLLGLPAPAKPNASKERETPFRDFSSVYPVHMSGILPEAVDRSEPGALSPYLLKQGIVPTHLKSSKSIRMYVSVPFLVSLYKNTKQENKNKISEHINKIGEGLLAKNGHSAYLSCVDLLEILNLPENDIFFIGDYANLTRKYLQKIKENLFVPPELDANDEHVESFYGTISTLFKAPKKTALKPAIATYFQTYLDLVKDRKNAKCRLSFEKNALVELLNCLNSPPIISKKEQKASYRLREKLFPKKGKKRSSIREEAQSISAILDQPSQLIAKVAKTTTEQTESLLNPFDKDAAEYLQLTKTPPGGEFPFPFTEQAESPLNPFDKNAAEYLQLTKTPPGGEFTFPFTEQAESPLNPFDKDAAEYLQLTKTPPGREFTFPSLD